MEVIQIAPVAPSVMGEKMRFGGIIAAAESNPVNSKCNESSFCHPVPVVIIELPDGLLQFRRGTVAHDRFLTVRTVTMTT